MLAVYLVLVFFCSPWTSSDLPMLCCRHLSPDVLVLKTWRSLQLGCLSFRIGHSVPCLFCMSSCSLTCSSILAIWRHSSGVSPLDVHSFLHLQESYPKANISKGVVTNPKLTVGVSTSYLVNPTPNSWPSKAQYPCSLALSWLPL